jgi:CRISPR-associated endoribonuclease Cas6
MPHSLVLNLIPRSTIYPDFLTGRHMHALFLTLVSAVNQELGDKLHEAKTDKAFTLSPLQIQTQRLREPLQDRHPKPIPAGTPCWWRISLLDDRLFGQLTQLWLNLHNFSPEGGRGGWHLGSADLTIASILGTPQASQPWANACSYQELFDRASDSNRTLRLTFVTPTSFRQGSFDSALPTRECVFNSLRSKWLKYSGIELPDLAIESIFPSAFEIRTEVSNDYIGKFIGTIGDVKYQIMGDVSPLQIKQLNALADFALYAGIGRKTPMGMGMARRL